MPTANALQHCLEVNLKILGVSASTRHYIFVTSPYAQEYKIIVNGMWEQKLRKPQVCNKEPVSTAAKKDEIT